MSLQKTCVMGASYGALAWTIYALVELLFTIFLPAVFDPATAIGGTNWQYVASLPIVFGCLGALLGVLAAVILSWAAPNAPMRELLRSVTTCTVMLALIVNAVLFASRTLLLDCIALLAPALACAFSLYCALRAPQLFRRFSWLFHPFTVAMMAVGTFYITKTALLTSSTFVRVAVWPPYVIACLLLVWVVSIVAARVGRPGWRDARLAQAWLALVLIFCAATVLANRRSSIPAARASAGNHRPNVVLVILDTVRADHLSLYGYTRPTTPGLQKLASDSVVYTNASSPCDISLGAHASLFTGLYPREHGAHFNFEQPDSWGAPLPRNVPTLPQIMAENGYTSIGAVANYGFLGPSFGLARGFDRYDLLIPFLMQPPSAFYLSHVIADVWGHIRPDLGVKFCSAREVTDDVIPILDGMASAPRPFFLFVNYMDAHWPYAPPPPFDSLYPGRSRGFTDADMSALSEDVLRKVREPRPDEREHLFSQYDGAITWLDNQVSRLVDHLKQRGLYDNTLLIIASDHGEAFGEKYLMGHGTSVYQDQVHVPLLVKYPRDAQVTPARVSEDVSLIDVVPTVLSAAGLKQLPGIHGMDLRRPSHNSQRVIMSETYPNPHLITISRFRRVERAAVTEQKKLIVSTLAAHSPELYDLSTDRDEMRNIYGSDDSSKSLEAALSRWLRAQTAVAQAHGRDSSRAVDQLRTLGYVQ